MTSKESAQRYMNIMAMSFHIVSQIKILFNQIFTISGSEHIMESVRKKLDSYWCSDNEVLLTNLEISIQNIIAEQNDIHRQIMAVAFCQWMDTKITYLIDENYADGVRNFFSLYFLVPLTGNNCVTLHSLNTNLEETGIWINPKLPTASHHITYDGESHEKDISNRDIFEGMNRHLHNCSYFSSNFQRKIINLVVSDDFLQEKEKPTLSIAFSPMTDQSDPVSFQNEMIQKDGIDYDGLVVEPLKDAEQLLERFKRDWILSCRVGADIVFAPELLGSTLSEANDGIYNDTIWELANQMLIDGIHVPLLTILPSYWSDYHNRSTIVGHDGEILACQEKHVPFSDIKGHKVEAILPSDEWWTVLIHIPNVHRIAVIICAEFLSDQDQLQKFICGSLGATLVIVPSYSRGEQDFINALSSLKPYGTSIIWGNCCGAVIPVPKAIGGCGIAGTGKATTFGSKCKCNFSCDHVKACIFKVEIPLNFELSKTSEPVPEELVVHHIQE